MLLLVFWVQDWLDVAVTIKHVAQWSSLSVLDSCMSWFTGFQQKLFAWPHKVLNVPVHIQLVVLQHAALQISSCLNLCQSTACMKRMCVSTPTRSSCGCNMPCHQKCWLLWEGLCHHLATAVQYVKRSQQRRLGSIPCMSLFLASLLQRSTAI